MRPRKKLPRSLRLAVIAGQFRQQRIDSMHAARGIVPGSSKDWERLHHVREARAINWVMITQLRAARAKHSAEVVFLAAMHMGFKNPPKP